METNSLYQGIFEPEIAAIAPRFADRAAMLTREGEIRVYGCRTREHENGRKEIHFDLAAYGACGYLSTFARIQPEVTRLYWNAFQNKDYNTAIRIIKEITNPYSALTATFRGGSNAGIYGSLELAGLASRNRRKPYATITDEDMEKLKAFHASIPDRLKKIK